MATTLKSIKKSLQKNNKDFEKSPTYNFMLAYLFKNPCIKAYDTVLHVHLEALFLLEAVVDLEDSSKIDGNQLIELLSV